MITLLTVAAIWMNEFLETLCHMNCTTGTTYGSLCHMNRTAGTTYGSLCHMNRTAGTTYAFSKRRNIYRNFVRLRYSLEFSKLHWKYRCQHIRLHCPPNPGSQHFNYKQYHSIVLQAVVDANLKFVNVDVGAFGKQSDGGVFRNSALYQSLETRSLQVPEDTVLSHSEITLSNIFVGDEAYLLTTYLI
jgi:hypothetical protein